MYVIGPTPPELFASRDFFHAVRRALRDGGADSQAGGAQVTKRATLMGMLGGAEFDGTPDARQHLFEEEEEDMWSALAEAPPLERAKALAVHDGKWVGRIISLHRLSKQHHRCGDPSCGTSPGGVVITVEEQLRLYCGVNLPASSSSSQSSNSTTTQSQPSFTYMPFGLGNGHVPPCAQAPMQPQPSSLRPKLTRGQNGVMQQHSPCLADFGFSFMPWSDLKVRSQKTPSTLDLLSGSGHSLMLCNNVEAFSSAPYPSQADNEGVRWLLDQVLVSDTTEPCDTLLFSTEALSDVAKLRSVVEGLLARQSWVICMKRAPEGVIDQITSPAGANAMLPGYHALPFMDQRVCVISVAAIIARAVLVAVRQWRKRTLADADPKARTCGCPLRSSAPIPDVLRYLRLCSRPTSLSSVPSSRPNDMTSAATGAGGTLRSLELGSQGLGQLWRSMTVKERHDLLIKLMVEASQAPVEAATPQHTHTSSSLSLSSSSSTSSVRSAASHDSPSPTGPSQKKHKSKCSTSSSSSTNSSPRRSPPERPVITPAAHDMVCDSLTSSPGLAEHMVTLPLGEAITVEVLCGFDMLGEVMLEALCVTPLSSSMNQHRVRMAGRVKRALEEFWADMHARRLLEEEQISPFISNGQGKESKDGSVAPGSGGAGSASRKPKKKNKKKAKTSASSSPARPMDASPSCPTPKPSSRSTTKHSIGTTPTTTKHTTTITTTSTPRKASDKPTPSASSSPPSNPPSSAAPSTSPLRSEASASSSSSPVVIPAPARGMSPPTREQPPPPSTTSPRRKQAASTAPSASSSPSCSMTPQQTASSCRSTTTKTLLASPRAATTETPCTQTDLRPDKVDAGTSSTANNSSSTRRGRLCSSPPRPSPHHGSAPATTATKKLSPPPSPQKTVSKDKVPVDGRVAAAPRKKLDATSAPATTPSGSGELTLSPTAEASPAPSTSKKATEAAAVKGSSSPQRPNGLCKKLQGTPHHTMSPPTRASSAPLQSQQQQSSSSAARSINGAPMGPYTPVSVEEVAGPLDLIGWDTSRRIRERLSEEIEEMAHGLVDVAMKRRPWQLHALTQLEQSLSKLWPSARMEVYGSFTTGLSMPASDVDVVISNLPEPTVPWVPHRGNGSAGPQHLITSLADHLKTQDWITSMQCITHTAVPLIKLTTAGKPTPFADTRGVIKIDISLDWGGTHRGVHSSHLVQRLCHVYRQLPPLVIVLKQLLLQRGLSDTYTGGLSSYALTIMVASVLQRHILEPPDVQPDVGTMFMAFLQTFGTRFDTRRYGVCLSPTGPLFPLSTWSPHLPRVGTPEYWQPADPVVIQDPLQPANNVGRACFGFRQVQVALDQCLTRILHYGERLISATSSSSSSSRKHTPSVLNNVLGACASPHPLVLDPPATADASGHTRTGSERRTATVCAHAEGQGQGLKGGKVVVVEEAEAHDKDEQGDDNDGVQAEDKDAIMQDGDKESYANGNARSVATPSASARDSQRTALTNGMSQSRGDQSPVTTASAVSTPDPVLAPEECSILGLAVFNAPHHRHVVELTAQVWCPPDMPPPPPTASNHISTCESRMYSRPVMQTLVTSEDAGRGRGCGGPSRPAYLRQYVPYVPTPPGGQQQQQQQAHVVAQPHHHHHHPSRPPPHHHHSISPYPNGGATYVGRGSGANGVVRRDGSDRGQPRWRTHGNFDGAQPPPPPPTSSKPRMHLAVTTAMGVPKAMGVMKASSHGLRVPPSVGGAGLITSADKAVQTLSGSRHTDTPLMAEAR